VVEPSAPEGVINIGGEWYYEEYARGAGVSSVGGIAIDGAVPATPAGTPLSPFAPGAPGAPSTPPYDKSLLNADGLPPPSRPQPNGEDRKSILDLFRN
jgi:penicillin-binding protein 1A